MDERTRSGLLNAGIAVLGVTLLVLLYGLVTRVLQPEAALPVALAAEGDIPQVEVLNGTGVDGLASQAREYLATRGVDVLATGNAPADEASRSVVLSRTGDLVPARRVAATLGLSERQVRSEPRPDLLLDATVILGADYRTLLPFLPDSSR